MKESNHSIPVDNTQSLVNRTGNRLNQIIENTRVSLWVAIAIPFSVIFLTTVTFQNINQIRLTNRFIEQSSVRLLDALSISSKNSLHIFLEEPFRIQLGIGHAIATHQLYDEGNMERVYKYIHNAYSNLYKDMEQISVLSFGSEYGEFSGIRRENQVGHYSLILKDASTKQKLLIFQNEKPKTIIAEFNNYDPRIRPWYMPVRGSQKSGWSPIYTNFDEREEITMSAISPVNVAGKIIGVMEADIKLDGLNNFLRNDPLRKNGVIFIVDTQGRLVAQSTPGSVVAHGNGQGARGQRLRMEESPSQYIRAAAHSVQILKDKENVNFDINVGRIKFYGRITKYTDSRGIDWRIVSLVPETDLMGDARDQNLLWFYLVFSLAIISGLLGLITIRRVIRSIEKVVSAAKELTLEKQGATIPASGFLQETKELALAFNDMSTRLRESYHTMRNQQDVLSETLEKNSAMLIDIVRKELDLRELNEELEKRVALRTEELTISNTALRSAIVVAENKSLEARQTLEQLKQAQSKLIQSEKMASLGQLVANVTHEINTPIGAIKSSGSTMLTALKEGLLVLPKMVKNLKNDEYIAFEQLIQLTQRSPIIRSSQDDRKNMCEIISQLNKFKIDESQKIANILTQCQTVPDDIEPLLPILQNYQAEQLLKIAYNISTSIASANNINTAVDNVSRIIFALKAYSRQGQNNTQTEIHVKETLDTVLLLYSNTIRRGIELVKNFSEVPFIYGFPEELSQVWTNLIHNAMQAMNYRGKLTIDLWADHHNIYVQFLDSGPGISMEIRDQIFDPFFTTKPIGEGSGLGLSISRNIIRKHGGDIEIDYSVKAGTAFIVSLPIAPQSASLN